LGSPGDSIWEPAKLFKGFDDMYIIIGIFFHNGQDGTCADDFGRMVMVRFLDGNPIRGRGMF
jgi:hypothetical protein